MALAWFSLLVSSLALAVSVQGQPGFISIDCGIAEYSTYSDKDTTITYQSDAKFIDTGINKELPEPAFIKFLNNVRSFPNGNRNCYNLSEITKGNKYLIRAYFLYGNYDGKNRTPEFDLYFGVNRWTTIYFLNPSEAFYEEIITVVTMNFISICLVDTGSGTPFISALELRPLKSSMYSPANERQSLWSRTGVRSDVGSSTNSLDLRYPEDPFDLIWVSEDGNWSSFNTPQKVINPNEAFQPPSAVMMTAIRPGNDNNELYYSWTAGHSFMQFHVYMYFAELERLEPNMKREFTVCCGTDSCFDGHISPEYLVTHTLLTNQPLSGQYIYSCSFKKTPSSTLPPILNAIEILAILQHNSTPTRDQDGIVDDNPDLCVSDSCSKDSNKQKIIILVVAPLAFVVILLILLIILWRFKLRKQDPVVMANEAGFFSSEKRRFTYAEVINMTNNLERSIGKGGFGTVYHGQMPDGTQVAVKMLSLQSVKLLSHMRQGSDEFQNEVQLLIRVHHRNLVPFIGYCQEGDGMALIYEYMAQGNLGSHLLGTNNNTKALNWGQRLRIALDIAQGLEYLHTGCKPAIIHRDMKTTNILLNERFEAKIGDFGLSKVFFKDDEQAHVSTAIKGTPGYLDPEYFHSNNLTQKSDVYGFGVILLEMITGQAPIIRILNLKQIGTQINGDPNTERTYSEEVDVGKV
ncbi:hypothetical protein AAC387_Pa03g4482 [Persea americana]